MLYWIQWIECNVGKEKSIKKWKRDYTVTNYLYIRNRIQNLFANEYNVYIYTFTLTVCNYSKCFDQLLECVSSISICIIIKNFIIVIVVRVNYYCCVYLLVYYMHRWFGLIVTSTSTTHSVKNIVTCSIFIMLYFIDRDDGYDELYSTVQSV